MDCVTGARNHVELTERVEEKYMEYIPPKGEGSKLWLLSHEQFIVEYQSPEYINGKL